MENQLHHNDLMRNIQHYYAGNTVMEHASGTSIPFCPGRTDGEEDGGASDFLMVIFIIIIRNDHHRHQNPGRTDGEVAGASDFLIVKLSLE